MANAKFDITTIKPVLAYVGVTDLAVEKVRDAVVDAQKRYAAVQKDVTSRVADLQKQARRTAIEARVAELQAEAKAYPTKVQALVDDNVALANATYADLVKRGESLVDRIRRQKSTQDTIAAAETTVAKAKTTATQARKAADAEKTATRKTATARKTAAKKSTAKKPTAKKAPARKAPAKETTAAERSAKATVTSAQNTATNAVKAVADAAEKVGD